MFLLKLGMDTVSSVLGFFRGGCDVPHRPQGCILSDFHLSGFSTISQKCLEWPSLLAQGALFWPFHSSLDLYQCIFSGVRVGSQKGNMSALCSDT